MNMHTLELEELTMKIQSLAATIAHTQPDLSDSLKHRLMGSLECFYNDLDSETGANLKKISEEHYHKEKIILGLLQQLKGKITVVGTPLDPAVTNLAGPDGGPINNFA